MPSEKDKALLLQLFFMNNESATVAEHNFGFQKNVKTGKGLSTVSHHIIKLVHRFEETGSLEDRVRFGRPCLRIAATVHSLLGLQIRLQ
ncbi:hypothetical protein TNCV_2144161 [Trichonephila clavipes]|nr:hypothetical protein TNCV_4569271 [Trichonephila clavipes]GFT96669.1 hypothetical protein TNCV_2144161 [Trichonephila clavipes]